MGALERDGWQVDAKKGAIFAYVHPSPHRRVAIHYHPKKTYGPGLLKALLEDVGWSEKDLRRLKLIK